MWKKVEETISPRVVQPSEGAAQNKSWASSSGVISATDLTRELFFLFLPEFFSRLQLLLIVINDNSTTRQQQQQQP